MVCVDMGERRFRLSLEHVVIAAVTVVGIAATSGRIADNSTFVHLRSGMDILSSGHIPRHDPYSFTAVGQTWVVQSWFAVITYAIAHELGGYKLFILEQMVLSGAIAFMMAVLCRAGTMTRTMLASVCTVTIAYQTWSHRPALFGLLGFAVLVWVVERKKNALWLLPVAWLWVNSHGSFPVGILWLGAYVLGVSIDRRAIDRGALRYFAVFVGGVLAGAINPLGPSILLFPARAFGARREAFANIGEWMSPNFHSGHGLIWLTALTVALLVLLNARVPWRYTFPVLFLAASTLYSQRNFPIFAIALCPALAALLSASSEERARKEADESKVLPVAAIGLLIVIVAFLVVRVETEKPFDFKGYPVAALDWMRGQGLLAADHRVMAQEITGCYRILRDGKNAHVFMDDRVDMYPPQLSEDYISLIRGDTDPTVVLSRYRIDTVLWRWKAPITQWLAINPGWHQVWSDKDFAVFVRATA